MCLLFLSMLDLSLSASAATDFSPMRTVLLLLSLGFTSPWDKRLTRLRDVARSFLILRARLDRAKEDYRLFEASD